MATKVLLVDGNSLIHRAYHAVSGLTTSTGQPTNAAFGFVQMLLALLEAETPDVAILALDAPGPTFRHELDVNYKAHRPEMDAELASQLGIIRELALSMGLAVTDLPGHEADDIIGTLSRSAASRGDEVLVVSGDRDMMQLVDPRVRVMATLKGISQTRVYDEAAVADEWGVSPEGIPELKGLAGDSSDNIPGVPKVGPKTALELIRQFGTVAGVYERLGEVQNEKLRARLAEHEDVARLSRRLAVIDCAAPVEPGLLERRWQGLQIRDLRRLLGELEFTSLLNRLPAALPEGQTICVAEGEEQIAAACDRAREAGAVGIAVTVEAGRATGLAVAVSEDRAEWIALPEPQAPDSLFAQAGEEALPQCLRDLLADDAVPKVGADLKGAARDLASAGLELNGLAFDTSVAAYLLAPHRSDQTLETMLAGHFGIGIPAADGPGTEAIAGPAFRAASAAMGALRLREPLTREMNDAGAWGLFQDMEMPLAAILRHMEAAGIAVDCGRLDEIGDRLSGMMLATSQRIHHLAGEAFNLESPKQTAEVLFEKLKLPHGRKTKTGWSTSADVLEELAPEHEIVALILQHREYSKLRSTYVDALMRLVSPADGRVHTTFEQAVASTGRLSSRTPNLQNIPVRTDWGREIRSCFVAQTAGEALIAADYSQIELRILAHMSGDESLVEAFRQGLDIHSTTAAAIFDVGLQDVRQDMRRTAKTVNYAIIYGMGAVALAKQLGIKRTEATQFIEHYFARLPRVKGYMEETVAQARERGYVETLLGRRRPTPELRSGDPRTVAYGERAAANAPLQGTAADIIKVAMVELAGRLGQVAPRCRMLLQVHDELVFELPQEEIEQATELIREVMESAAALTVPLVVDVKIGANWRDMEYA